MTAFVKECRQEWKRLGVPDLLADEMAADLEADLAEAEAEGVSTAEIVGESDPRRFAATWASERGLVPEQPPQKRRRRVWPWVLVFVFIVLLLSWLALQTVGTSHSTNSGPVQPPRHVSVPNVIGMRACKAVRTVARTGVDDWRIAGHAHGYDCDLIVLRQTPAPGRIIGRHVTMTLRLGRS